MTIWQPEDVNRRWNEPKVTQPQDNQLVETMKSGQTRMLRYTRDGLWWTPDMTNQVFYIPDYWRNGE